MICVTQKHSLDPFCALDSDLSGFDTNEDVESITRQPELERHDFALVPES